MKYTAITSDPYGFNFKNKGGSFDIELDMYAGYEKYGYNFTVVGTADGGASASV